MATSTSMHSAPASWSSEVRRAPTISQSQVLFGQPLRLQVLPHPSAFKQEWRDLHNTIDQAASSLAAKARQRHDQHAKPLPVLTHDTVVRVQHPRSKRWDTVAEVIEVKRSGRSSGVKTENGRVLWRKRHFLRLFYQQRFDVDIYFSTSISFVVFFLLSGLFHSHRLWRGACVSMKATLNIMAADPRHAVLFRVLHLLD